MDWWSKTEIDLANEDAERTDFDEPLYVVPYEVDTRAGSATYGQMLFELWPHPKKRVRNKRVWASVKTEASKVIDQGIEEALRRDPEKKRLWVVLIDGQDQQLKNVKAALARHGVDNVVFVLDPCQICRI